MIKVKGASANNLQNVDVSIPKNKLTVVTGVSGSGKSSFAFDTLFEEGKRQYLEALGMSFDHLNAQYFESIEGLGPTIAVKQSVVRQSNPRSVVGTKTKLLNRLSILYAFISNRENNYSEFELTGDYFNFNSYNGMCHECRGMGTKFELNYRNLIPDETMTVTDVLDNLGLLSSFKSIIKNNFNAHLDDPFILLPKDLQNRLIYGVEIGGYRERSRCLFDVLKSRLKNGEYVNDVIYPSICGSCSGTRVGELAREVTIQGKHIGELGALSLEELNLFLAGLSERIISKPNIASLVSDIKSKLESLLNIGLKHLTLHRAIPTLSGGEYQRLILASHISSRMNSLIYIMDEPTIGLHESEKERLLEGIQNIKDLGNSVVIVEHDPSVIKKADYVVEFGPLAGDNGGRVIFEGCVDSLMKSKESLLSKYIQSKSESMLFQKKYLSPEEILDRKAIKIEKCTTNNLKDITLSIPLNVAVGVAGCSGSGKSSLVQGTLVPLLKAHFRKKMKKTKKEELSGHDEYVAQIKPRVKRLSGLEQLTGYAEISQAPIGRRQNSNPASYLKIWDMIRELFSRQDTSLSRSYTAGHFSFNSKGACDKCHGSGIETIWLGDGANVTNSCSVCEGKRYKDDILEVQYNGKNILDVLEMCVTDAALFFKDVPGIQSVLDVLDRTGMGYVTLGQPATTLSGGEAQRIKLAKEIGRKRKGNILYVLDEPTTGLSLHDISKLLVLLKELIDQGNSVILVEHDPEVLSFCDWLIELGPESGISGGYVVAEGTPQELKEMEGTVTGPYLIC